MHHMMANPCWSAEVTCSDYTGELTSLAPTPRISSNTLPGTGRTASARPSEHERNMLQPRLRRPHALAGYGHAAVCAVGLLRFVASWPTKPRQTLARSPDIIFLCYVLVDLLIKLRWAVHGNQTTPALSYLACVPDGLCARLLKQCVPGSRNL